MAEGLAQRLAKMWYLPSGPWMICPSRVVPQLHGGVFKAVLLVARSYGGGAPGGGGERRDNGRGKKVVDEGLGRLRGSGENEDGGSEKKKTRACHVENSINDGGEMTMRHELQFINPFGEVRAFAKSLATRLSPNPLTGNWDGKFTSEYDDRLSTRGPVHSRLVPSFQSRRSGRNPFSNWQIEKASFRIWQK